MLIVAVAIGAVTGTVDLIIMAADITELIVEGSTVVIIMVIMVTMVPDSVLALVGDIHTSVYTLGHYHLAVIPFIGIHTHIIITEGRFTDHTMMDMKW